jgi:hypothetical protein
LRRKDFLNFFVKYGLRFVFVNAAYTFYYAPLAFGLSLHELPSAICTFLAKRMDMGVLDVMYNQLGIHESKRRRV